MDTNPTPDTPRTSILTPPKKHQTGNPYTRRAHTKSREFSSLEQYQAPDRLVWKERRLHLIQRKPLGLQRGVHEGYQG